MEERPLEIVAHRAGNQVATARAALETGVDVLELDLHVLRGRVELRHAKVIRPGSRLWEKWYLLPRGTTGVPVQEVLDVLDPAMPLMLDLKCFTPLAARRIARAVPATHPVIASTRSWWLLGAFRGRPGARRLRSCRSRFQLWLATRLPGLGPDDGVCAHASLLDAAGVAAILERTPQLFTWAVASPAHATELRTFGVRGLIVDDLALDWRA